jgi:hypothetical protein
MRWLVRGAVRALVAAVTGGEPPTRVSRCTARALRSPRTETGIRNQKSSAGRRRRAAARPASARAAVAAGRMRLSVSVVRTAARAWPRARLSRMVTVTGIEAGRRRPS